MQRRKRKSKYVTLIKKLIGFDRVYVYSNNVYYLLAVAIIFGAKAKRLVLKERINS